MSVHIYFGDGKGKSTCAAGLSARFASYCNKVDFFRFLKCKNDGECKVLNKYITFHCVDEKFKFLWEMNEHEKKEISDKTRRLWQSAKDSRADMIVLDEILDVVDAGFVENDDLINFVRETNAEIVLTGRRASEKLLQIADYVTEMKKIKHPFDLGISAKEGIEF